jgi:hypothetical protein
MNEILHANIFFVIASVATVCFFILVSIALYHVIKILRLVRSVLERVDAGVEVLASDVSQVRMFFSEGSFLSRLASMIPGVKPTKSRRKRTNVTRDVDDDSE